MDDELVCVAVILRFGDHVLAERRKADKRVDPGALALPGGHVEPGEDLVAALARELREELGIVPLAPVFVCTQVHRFEEIRRLHYFAVERWSGEIQNNEAESLHWIKLDDLGSLDIPADRSALARYAHEQATMRRRPAAKLIVLDPDDRVLLFRFRFETGPLAGEEGWCAPGGGLEPGESFEAAAQRELKEETGFDAEVRGPPVAAREFTMRLPDGELVIAEERYFVVRSVDQAIDRSGWTELERDTMVEHRWWSVDELLATKATVFPEGLIELLASVQGRVS